MSKPSDKTRLSRYRADRKAFPDFQPSERHQRILLLVHAHRFLDTELLWHLLRVSEPEAPAHGVKSGFGKEALYKALQKLFNAGYLNRHFLYDVPIGRGMGTPPTVYGLGTKSARLLSALLGCSPRDVQYIVEANKVKTPFLRHALEIARFRVTVEHACANSHGQVRLVFWEQGMRLRDFVTVRNPSLQEAQALKAYGSGNYPEEKQLSVCPDAMFALEVQGKGRACYMLEIDRGSMPIRRKSNRSDIVQKLIAYGHYRRSKRQEQRYAFRVIGEDHAVGLLVNNQPDAPVEHEPGVLPIRGFNVLFVIPTGFAADGRPSGRIANILSELMQLGSNYASTSLFWFTTPDRYDLTNHSSIFERIWTCANSNLGLQSLTE